VEQGYRGPQACKIIGITYRQLDYWARTDLVKPSLKDANGSGTQRLYSFQDLVHLKVIKNLLDAGVNLPQIRKAVEFLKDELRMPLEKVTLLSDGNTVYAATSDKDPREAPPGRGAGPARHRAPPRQHRLLTPGAPRRRPEPTSQPACGLARL
jgi:DNA-binding transcriptional MerR regulator